MKVTCVSATQEPKKVVALGVLNMRGDMRHSVNEVSNAEADEIFEEMLKTGLNGVFEWLNITFQIEGVTRAFTHQLVRHRVGFSYSQESMRFTQVENLSGSVLAGPSVQSNKKALEIYDRAVEHIEIAYQQMLEAGAATQDARGILPTNVLTKIGLHTNYRALIGLAGDRLCLQAQDEWRDVVAAMKEEVRRVWGNELADYLLPCCYHDKHCHFESIFDRECPLQEKWR